MVQVNSVMNSQRIMNLYTYVKFFWNTNGFVIFQIEFSIGMYINKHYVFAV